MIPAGVLAVSAIAPPSIDAAKSLELVNAAPSDFRAILAAMIVLLFVQTVERWWAGFRAGNTAQKFATASEKMIEAITTLGSGHAATAFELRTTISEQAGEIRSQASEIRSLVTEVRSLRP